MNYLHLSKRSILSAYRTIIFLCMIFFVHVDTNANIVVERNNTQLLELASSCCYHRLQDQNARNILSEASTKFSIPELIDYANFLSEKKLDIDYQFQKKVISRLLNEAEHRYGKGSKTSIRCRRNYVNCLWQTDSSLAIQIASENRLFAYKLFQRDTNDWNSQLLYLLCRLEELKLISIQDGENPLFMKEVYHIEHVTDSLFALHSEDTEVKLDLYCAFGGYKPLQTVYSDFYNELYNLQFPNGTLVPSIKQPTGFTSNAPNYLKAACEMAERIYGPEDLRTLNIQIMYHMSKIYFVSEPDPSSYVQILLLERPLRKYLPKGDPILLYHTFLSLYYESLENWDIHNESKAIEFIQGTKKFYGPITEAYIDALFSVTCLQSMHDPQAAKARVVELLQIGEDDFNNSNTRGYTLLARILPMIQNDMIQEYFHQILSRICTNYVTSIEQSSISVWDGVYSGYYLLSLCGSNHLIDEAEAISQACLTLVQKLAPEEPILELYMLANFYSILIQSNCYELAGKLLSNGIEKLLRMNTFHASLYIYFVKELSLTYVRRLDNLDLAESLLDNQISIMQTGQYTSCPEIVIDLMWERLSLVKSKTNDPSEWHPIMFQIAKLIKEFSFTDSTDSLPVRVRHSHYNIGLFREFVYLYTVYENYIDAMVKSGVPEKSINKIQQMMQSCSDFICSFENEMSTIFDHPENCKLVGDYSLWILSSSIASVDLSIRKDTIMAEKALNRGFELLPQKFHAIVYNELAGFYLKTKNFSKSLDYSLKIEDIVRKDPILRAWIDNQQLITNICFALYRLGQYERAIPYAEKCYLIKQEQLRRNMYLMTAEEREKFIHTKGGHGNAILKNLLPHVPERLTGEVYQSILTEKGYLLRVEENIQSQIKLSGDPVILQISDSLKSLSQQLDRKSLYDFDWQSLTDSPGETVYEIKQQIQRLERKLNHLLDYSGFDKSEQIEWHNIQNRLDSTDVAIEFFTTEYNVCALILRKDQTLPQFVKLGVLEDFKREVPLLRHLDSKQMAEELYTNDKLQLYARIWEPILPSLKGIRRIFFSPAGFLNSFSLSAVLCPDGTYMLDNYQMYQLTSTAELVHNNSTAISSDSVFELYGAAYYSPSHSKEDDLFQSLRGVPEQDFRNKVEERSSNGEFYGFLPYSRTEIEDISRILRNKGITPHVKFGNMVTESAFRNLSGHSPSVIHLATHGFLIRTEDELMQNVFLSQFPNVRYSSMMHTGIALSGANQTWYHGDLETENDGILTAREISQMDLRRTRLIVLSACETGLGFQTEEGVYGLYRGFKLAGVKSLLVSLWKVSDRSTSELMAAFYRNWLAGIPIQEAYTQAVKDIRKKYKSPYYWAPFVLLDSL